jgi:hypothetical protein
MTGMTELIPHFANQLPAVGAGNACFLSVLLCADSLFKG